MESRRDKDANRRRVVIGAAGRFVTIDHSDLARVLGEDRGGLNRAAFQRLCKAGCNAITLTYILKVTRDKLPSYWWNGPDETDRQALGRREDAAILERAASLIESRFAPFIPSADLSAERIQDLVNLDELAIRTGGLWPMRLAAGLHSFAQRLLTPEAMREQGLLRANQDDFDMIARYVLCAYVHRTTGDWHDADVALLLSTVGNHKPTRGDSELHDKALRQWRANNFERFDQFCSFSVDQLMPPTQPDVEGPPSK